MSEDQEFSVTGIRNMSLVKHHLLLLDKSLCEDANFFSIISDCFKSALLLADHFNNSNNQSNLCTIGICVIEFKEDVTNIQSVLLPIVPGSSILSEIIASMNLLAPKTADRESSHDMRKEI